MPKKVRALWTLTGKAAVTGIAFVNPLYGQGRVASNGIELDPVLDLTYEVQTDWRCALAAESGG